MPLTVENGSGLANADSYSSLESFRTFMELYHDDLDIDDAAAETALRRATLYIDSHYRDRWPGQRLRGRAQRLEWPRRNVLADSGEPVPDNAVPSEVIEATQEAARRELAEPNSLLRDVTPAQQTIRETVGPLTVEYASGRLSATEAAQTVMPSIDAIIAPMLLRRGPHQFLKRV